MAKTSHAPLETQLSNTQIVLTSLCAGAVAGALAKTTIAPLDRTKINFQISNRPYSTKKALKFLLQTYREQGFFALWRGNSATMVRIVPHAAIQFTAHEQWKKILKVDNKNSSPKKLFLAGSLAGATSQSLTYPLDVARARMAVTRKHEYATLRQVFYKVFHEEGIAAFYKGYIPTIAGVVPYAGVSFFTYDTLKMLYRDYAKLDYDATLNPVFSLGFGAIAGMLGQCSSYPLDIVRRRMQTDTQGKYKSIRATIRIIYQEGIIGGFYKGLSMNWIKGPIAVGISYSSYDNIRSLLRQLSTKYNNRKFL
jgi:solute carrier family 25 protein 42